MFSYAAVEAAETQMSRSELDSDTPFITTDPLDVIVDDFYVDLSASFENVVYLKFEGLNLAGSVKVKAARGMVNAAIRSGTLRPGDALVESSSGSLGVALAMAAAFHGIAFTCVTDSRCNSSAMKLMRTYGAEVVVITEPHPEFGLLGSRLDYIVAMLARDPRVVWLNQYANEHNWKAHHATTGPQVAKHFPDARFVFIGAGTTGTLTGTARFLKESGHPARIVAVDTVGSVTFGQPARTRHIPGLGTGRRPEIVDESVLDELIMVPEAEAIRVCRTYARRGFLLGGSTGAVLAGARHRLQGQPKSTTSVVICPDLGDRYLDTVYDDAWVAERFDLDTDRSVPFDVDLKGTR